MDNKEDLRVVKTKKIIKEAFLELVNEKGYNNVSITDIAKKANISRNAFYIHYEDKRELLYSLFIELGKSIDSKYKSFLESYPVNEQKITKKVLRVGLRKLLMIIDNEIDLFKVIIFDSSLSDVLNKVTHEIKKTVASYFNIENYDKNIRFEYCFNGAIGVINNWLFNYSYTTNETSKELASLVYQTLYENN